MRGDALNKLVRTFPSFLGLMTTKKRSKLPIKTPQKRPKAVAIWVEPKTVNKAYPPDKEAKLPVQSIIIPIATCLFCSATHSGRSNTFVLAPPMLQTSFVKGFI